MATVLSSINLKGGVGKTTIAVNFAAYAGAKGFKTLLIDLDPQANASFASIGVEEWEKHSNEKGTIADLLGVRAHNSAEGKTKTAEEVLFESAFDNVDLIPSHVDLFLVDLDLASATARETRLRKAIKPIEDNYDLIICDCPPNLTLPTQNALAISTHYVIPVSLDFLSALGISLLLSRVEDLSHDLERDLSNAGIIISRVGRKAQHREVTETTIRAQFGDLVFSNVIRDRVAVSEAAEAAQSVFEGNNRELKGEFNKVCATLAKRIGLK